MKFLNYETFNESERGSVAKGTPMSLKLKNSLERIGKSFKTDEDIVKAIESLGYTREPLKANSRSAEYIFVKGIDKESGLPSKYVTYSNGYVRAIMPKGAWGRRFSKGTHNMTPISDQLVPTTRERLLLVFRRALKESDLYKLWIQTWKKRGPQTDDPVAEFFEIKKGALLGIKYGL